MHFPHVFFGPPPPLHVLPIILTSGLAFAVGAYYVARNGMPESVAAFGKNLLLRIDTWRSESFDNRMQLVSRNSGSTGNAAFEDYRAATLKTLEEEAAEFRVYLNGLRLTADKTEFEAFLKTRREQTPQTTSE